MTIELATIFLELNFVILCLICGIYFVLRKSALWKLTILLIAIDLTARIIHKPLFNVENVRFFWYLVWAIFNLASLLVIYKITIANPNLQKVTLPIGFLIIIGSFITLGRHFERNITDTNFLKQIYSVSDQAVGWLIIAYLFAPIALLLVKSIRGRISAKH